MAACEELDPALNNCSLVFSQATNGEIFVTQFDKGLAKTSRCVLDRSGYVWNVMIANEDVIVSIEASGPNDQSGLFLVAMETGRTSLLVDFDEHEVVSPRTVECNGSVFCFSRDGIIQFIVSTRAIVNHKFNAPAADHGVACVDGSVVFRSNDGRVVVFDPLTKTAAALQVDLPEEFTIEGAIGARVLVRYLQAGQWHMKLVDKNGMMHGLPAAIRKKEVRSEAPAVGTLGLNDDSWLVEVWDVPFQMEIVNTRTGAKTVIKRQGFSGGRLLLKK